jgi:hypothetical protein
MKRCGGNISWFKVPNRPNHTLVRNLLRRFSLLYYFHCGGDPSNRDFKGLIEKARAGLFFYRGASNAFCTPHHTIAFINEQNLYHVACKGFKNTFFHSKRIS